MLRRVLGLAAAGAAAGTLVGLWASRLIQGLLYGTDARDPSAFAAAALVLLMVVAFAGWLPARRASRIDPAATLRQG
jgi:ABC-type antimicrobial peptide transport system permease subunit